MNEKQFGILPVRKIFFKMAVPNLLSMLFASIYMIMDGIFVGRYIGTNALAAINLLMPIIIITFAFADMVAIGSSVKISIALGEKNEEKASRLFTLSLCIIWVFSIIILVLGILFAENIIYFFIKDPVLAALAFDYGKVFIYTMPLVMPVFMLDNYLRVSGKPKFSMWMNIAISILNVFLDWLFIAHYHLGIEYASLASAISMSLGTIITLIPFIFKKYSLRFIVPKVSLKDIIGIFYNGSSEFFNNISGSIMAAVINIFLLNLGGALAVAAYSIMMYIDSLLITSIYGIIDSIQPVISYNLGAKKNKRILDLFKISCITAFSISMFCMVGLLLFPDFLAGLFAKDADAKIIQMTKTALILFAPSYLFTWFNMVASSFLTGVNKPKQSLIIMSFRSVIFPLISLFIMTNLIGVNGVFITPTFAGALTCVVSVIMWVPVRKSLKAAIRK